MKSSKLLPLAVILATPLLTQCLVVDENGNAVTTTPSSSPNVSGSPAQTRAVYDKAFQRGLSDGRGGLSRTPGRYAGTYPPAESDAFDSGYEKGYNAGIR